MLEQAHTWKHNYERQLLTRSFIVEALTRFSEIMQALVSFIYIKVYLKLQRNTQNNKHKFARSHVISSNQSSISCLHKHAYCYKYCVKLIKRQQKFDSATHISPLFHRTRQILGHACIVIVLCSY